MNQNYNNKLQAMKSLCIAIIKQALTDKDYLFFLTDSSMLDIVLTLSEINKEKLLKEYKIEENYKEEKIKQDKKILSESAKIKELMDGTKTAVEIANIMKVSTKRVYEVYRYCKDKGYSLQKKKKEKKNNNNNNNSVNRSWARMSCYR